MNPKILLSLLLIGTTLVSAQAQASCNVYCANTAVLNKTIGPSGSVDRTAWFFDQNYYAPSVYEPQEGHCTLQAAFNDNQLTITGVVYDPANPTTGFFINIQSTKVTSGESYLELASSAYVANGGWVDPSTWTHYTLSSGSLTGFGTWQDVKLSLTESMHPLQVGVGANGKNANFGLSAWFEFNGLTIMSDINVDLVCPPAPPTAAPTPAPPATDAPTSAPVTEAPTSAPVTDAPTSAPVTDAPTSAPVTDAPTSAPVTDAPTQAPSTDGSGVTGETSTSDASSTSGSTTGDESYICPPNPYVARQAIADQFGGNSYFAFIFNTSDNVQYRFDFVNDDGEFKVNSDGTASITGTLAPLSSNPDDGAFDFGFSAAVNFIPGSVPAMFHKELKDEAYVPNGPVDPATWIFYAFSSATITPANSRYSIAITPYMDMDFQVGIGANGKNVNYGASAWFSFYLVDNSNNALVASGVMDINVDLVCTSPGGSLSSGSGSAGTGSGSDSATTSVVSDGSISGGVVSPSTSASPSPATTASSASVVSTSMMMLVMLLAVALNL